MNCYLYCVKEILLCSHNPLLIKNLYGILRDEGYHVEIVDHPALAVQMVLKTNYHALIIDSEPFGLSSEEAIRITRSVLPHVPIIAVGNTTSMYDALSLAMPVDLGEFKQAIHDIHSLGIESHTG
jgi:DNA-binding response OmpR family regulator